MNKEIWTIGRILQWTEQYFSDKGVDTPRLDGEILLSHILGKERIYLYTHYDQPLEKEELDRYRPLVINRAKGHCVASLVGYKDFMGLSFKVNGDVLIPRPDTETLVEGILAAYDNQMEGSILDVCTGPGTILLSLLHYMPHMKGVGLELSPKALALAQANADQLGLADRVDLRESDMFAALAPHESFDLILSNPPYITSKEMKTLSADVLNEPSMALWGGEDGIDFYRILAKEAPKYLKAGGLLAMEIGQGQEESVTQLLQAEGTYEDISYWKDLASINRVVLAKKVNL